MPLEFAISPVRLLAPCGSSVAFLDNQHVIYISGRVAVILNILSKIPTFLPPRNSLLVTSSFCLSPDGQLLATLEVGPKSNVVIYEIMPPRRRKAIAVHIAAKHEEKVAFAFSGDAKLLAILVPESATVPSTSNNANYTVSLYLWRTGKILASVNLGSAGVPTFCPQLSFNPTDANSVAVVYSGSLRFYRLSPDGLETATKPKLSGHIITCHAWITSSRIVTGTTTGQALIVEDGEIISKVALTEDKSGSESSRSVAQKSFAVEANQVVTAAYPFGTNRISYGIGANVVVVTEALDTKGTMYQNIAVLSMPSNLDAAASLDGKCCMSMSIYHGKQLVAVASQAKIWLSEINGRISSQGKPIIMENLVDVAHVGPIRGLSAAEWRPYAVTVGQDHCLCLWNITAGQIEFRKEMDDDILSVSIHPTGHYVAVTTSDSLQVYSVLVDRFHLVKELILPGCQKLAFNAGGNWIAVTRGSTLQLVSFITFDTSPPMVAHKAEITQIVWSEDGQRLYSCGEDGQLCEWDLLNKTIRTQVKPDGGALVALTALSNGNLIVATDEGSILEVASNGQVMARVKSADLFATCLQFLSRDQVVLVGTKTGSIRTYKYPLSNRSEFQEHFTQLGSISHIAVTSDNQNLVTCSDDGSMCFWRLGEASKQQWNPLSENGNQECLVLRIDWTNQSSLLENTTRQLNEVKRETELHVKAVEQQHAEQAQETETKFRLDLEAANEQIKELKAQLKQQSMESEAQLVQLRSEFEAERKHLEETHQTKLANAFKRHEELEDQIQEMQCKHLMEMGKLELKLKNDYGNKEHELRDNLEQTLRELEERKHHLQNKVAGLEAALKLTSEKAEADQRSLQGRHELQLSTEKQMNLKLRGEAGILKKSITSLQKELEIQRQTSTTQQAECQRMSISLNLLNQDIKELQEELARRDHVIRAKDERLLKLYNQIQQQEKVQNDFKTQLEDMKKKFHATHLESTKLVSKLQEAENLTKMATTEAEEQKRIVEQMQGKARSQAGELQSLRHKFQNQQSRLQEILVCLDVGMTYLYDAKQLKEYFAAIHEVYCGKDHGAPQRPASAVFDDFQLHRKVESLENTVSSLRHQLAETIKLSQGKNEKLIRDNSLLLSELENARQSLQTMKQSGPSVDERDTIKTTTTSSSKR